VVYDATSNVVRQIDERGYTTTFAYDALDRRVSVQDAGGGIATTVYDANDNVVNTIDAAGNKATYVYDALDRRTQGIDPRGSVTTTLYDSAGNETGVIDPLGNRTTFVYDALDRLTQQTDPLNKSSTFAYDAIGRMTSSTDRLGRVQNFSYDAANRLTGKTWVVGGSTTQRFTYTYDANDNRLTAANGAGIDTMTYDALDRLATVQEPFGVRLTYSYDATSNVTQVQDSFGGVLTSTYNQVNLLSSRELGGTGVTPLRLELTYTPTNELGTLTRYSDLAGSHTVGISSYSYDAPGRLTNLQHKDGSSNLLANFTTTYDAASRATADTINGTTTSYSYDAASQLTAAGSAAYSYDANGNPTNSGDHIGANNQLTSDGTWTYTYDAEGNLSTKTDSAGDVWTYSYDLNNHLTGAVETNGATTLAQATYVYDALDNRIEADDYTSTGGVTTVTRFAYDGDNVLADLDSTNRLLTWRVYGDDTNQLVARESAAGAVAWYLTDREGSVRNLVDANGTLQDTIAYDPFGSITSESAASFGDRYKYTAEQWDGVVKLQYNGGRYYDPFTQRWTSQDPIGFDAGDANLHRYAGNNPTNLSDPTGMDGMPTQPTPGGAPLIENGVYRGQPIQVDRLPVLPNQGFKVSLLQAPPNQTLPQLSSPEAAARATRRAAIQKQIQELPANDPSFVGPPDPRGSLQRRLLEAELGMLNRQDLEEAQALPYVKRATAIWNKFDYAQWPDEWKRQRILLERGEPPAAALPSLSRNGIEFTQADMDTYHGLLAWQGQGPQISPPPPLSSYEAFKRQRREALDAKLTAGRPDDRYTNNLAPRFLDAFANGGAQGEQRLRDWEEFNLRKTEEMEARLDAGDSPWLILGGNVFESGGTFDQTMMALSGIAGGGGNGYRANYERPYPFYLGRYNPSSQGPYRYKGGLFGSGKPSLLPEPYLPVSRPPWVGPGVGQRLPNPALSPVIEVLPGNCFPAGTQVLLFNLAAWENGDDLPMAGPEDAEANAAAGEPGEWNGAWPRRLPALFALVGTLAGCWLLQASDQADEEEDDEKATKTPLREGQRGGGTGHAGLQSS
jgi:RHS repeat-associated protein